MNATSSRYSSPDRVCDIVMKGGITSGVVYPLAVCELASRFRFKSIGGTSAGAIAAAEAAAAEFGRARGGFEKLAAVPAWLGEHPPGGLGSNLGAFFQPQSETQPVFDTLMAGLGAGQTAPLKILAAGMLAFPQATLIGALPGAGLIALAAAFASGLLWFWCIATGILALMIGVSLAVAGALILRVVTALPNNNYGLCSGLRGSPESSGQPLTEWLSDHLDDLAGKQRSATGGDGDGPLTFGNLWWPSVPTGDENPGVEPALNLEMFTSCLTHGHPYRLPFRDEERVHDNVFYFRAEDFRRLFPPHIVNWMIQHPRRGGSGRVLPEGFHPLPDPWNLPVIVAARLSLSFPFLLSAVPLYSVDHSRVRPEDQVLEKCWFSDGGIASNFPVHLFDAPLPRWPTFAINLCEKHPDHPVGAWMPSTNRSGLSDAWNRFDAKSGLGRITGFLGAIFNTMQNWNDHMQSRLPGYRDRIAHVSLTSEEGGLNLNMPAERIQDLSERGREAGMIFLDRFANPQTTAELSWSNHRWVRFRSTVAALQDFLFRFDRACAHPQPGDLNYETWTATAPNDELPSYAWSSQKQRDCALEVTRAVRAISGRLTAAQCELSTNAPRPRPELRPRPWV